MNYRRLTQFFSSRRQRRQPLALATVFETRGSTYSKAGARMLIDENGIFQGMLSGGCLEGDLAIRAQQVIESRKPQIVSYDLAADDDELWGLGIGCDGLMRVLLQPLSSDQEYQPFTTLVELLSGTEQAAAATVVNSEIDAIEAGASLLNTSNTSECFGLGVDIAERLREKALETLATVDVALEDLSVNGGVIQVFYSLIRPVPRVLILGAGLDAEPVVSFSAELGWRCTVVDHRPAYIDNNDFAAAEQTLCCPVQATCEQLNLDDFDMAVVMSHHLASDRGYLRQLADSDIAYIGLLGPAGRRRRVLEELGDTAEKLLGRVHGPAGLDLGGRGPAAIALSIVAEMQRVLTDR